MEFLSFFRGLLESAASRCFVFPLQQSVQNFLPEFSLGLLVQSITQRLFTISAALPMIFCLNAPGADADC